MASSLLTPPRVVIADDSCFMRRLPRHALQTAGPTVVGEAADGDEALALCRRHRPEARSPLYGSLAVAA
ncbi:MAG TPA: hypothetical protein VNT54_13545 [Solirubrobacteraceae bacterium]|nr:hypothetical protein [Solirubrobacteraceae bacterium]